ncbi:hypothetical protein CC86DRAFT_389129 [Ophiobolus disseminans]|uniref:C2H2-type domain-containing protein n=1 Tax=Ophiobolus disseminans TaxID=1469910 RepID=A0A6A6ZBU1_9PLEO|nr:hypothetical protein CC86DRAFT_389129 [Ophiobolus disseminans]
MAYVDFEQPISRVPAGPNKTGEGEDKQPSNTKVCNVCGYAVAAVDLRKHIERHAKLYGCTYPKCHKHFSAKSDWKRHESSQHFQLEAFRCGQELLLGQACGEHFFRIEPFKQHLKTQHEIAQAEEQEAEAKSCRIEKIAKNSFGKTKCSVGRALRSYSLPFREGQEKHRGVGVCEGEQDKKGATEAHGLVYIRCGRPPPPPQSSRSPQLPPPPPPPPVDVDLLSSLPAEDSLQVAGQKRASTMAGLSDSQGQKRHRRDDATD